MVHDFFFLNQKEEHVYSGSEEVEKKDFLVKVWQLEVNFQWHWRPSQGFNSHTEH